MSRPPSSHPERGGYTILVVPDRGAKAVRQLHLTPRQLRFARTMGAASAVVLALLVTGLALFGARIWAYDDLVQENLVLRQHLESIDNQLERVDDALRRIRLYDTQIRHLSHDADLPGFGPVDEDEQERWTELWGVDAPTLPNEQPAVPSLDGAESVPGSAGVGPIDIRPAELWAMAVEDRAAQLVGMVDEMEPRMSAMVQDLEDWRSYRSALPAIWPAYGISALVLGGLLFDSRRRLSAGQAALARLGAKEEQAK